MNYFGAVGTSTNPFTFTGLRPQLLMTCAWPSPES
jgi:hypothetical protein